MLAVSLVALVASLARPAAADPVVIDQVVARVDGRPILLSELRARARPLLLPYRDAPAWRRAAALRKALAELLDRRIDEELVAAAAHRRALVVGEGEVEQALARIAETNRLSRAALLKAAVAAGYSPEQYREEVRRQLLAQRLVYDEANRRRQPAPGAKHYEAWSERMMKRVLDDARRQTCIERRVRF